MSRVAYVNGQYLPHGEATIHIDDRGYQFADGVYEVCAVLAGRIVDMGPHLARLDRSLSELRIAAPMSAAALKLVLAEVVRRNRVRNGLVYLQVTRGVARRDHPFPRNTPVSLVITARPLDFGAIIRRAEKGVAVITTPDIRWARRDIKSISLLPNILAKQAAKDAGAFEAWMVDDGGYVTEGSSTNAWIVDADGALVTRALSSEILPGVTRGGIIRLASELGIRIVERKFTVAEALSAREVFLTSTTAFATPVTSIDGQAIGNGAPGSVCLGLIRHYWHFLRRETGVSLQDIPEIPV